MTDRDPLGASQVFDLVPRDVQVLVSGPRGQRVESVPEGSILDLAADEHAEILHPVPRWEVRVTHYREDGTAATEVETLLETELAARRLPIGPWVAIRGIAGRLVNQIEHAELRRG